VSEWSTSSTISGDVVEDLEDVEHLGPWRWRPVIGPETIAVTVPIECSLSSDGQEETSSVLPVEALPRRRRISMAEACRIAQRILNDAEKERLRIVSKEAEIHAPWEEEE